MSSFERFRQNQILRAQANQRFNSTFLMQGASATRIKNVFTDVVLNAAVYNKQESDIAYIYTDIKNPIEIGSIWEVKSLHLIVTEHIEVIKDVNWYKYKCLVCNAKLGDNLWGYFKGPEASYVQLTTRKEAVIESQQKPLLVTTSARLNYKDKIVINNRPWLVQEYDDVTHPGVTYYSLKPTTISKITTTDAPASINPVINPYPEIDDSNRHITISPEDPIIFDLADQFVDFEGPLVIVKRTARELTCTLKFGSEPAILRLHTAAGTTITYHIALKE